MTLMPKPRISVLMAVYDAGRFLDKSIGSVLRQTFTDFELICIDDCSTDSSRNVLRRYAAEDPRVGMVFLPHNHGPAYARNAGLKIARGEYVTFLDADDWLADDALEQIVETFDRNPKTDCVLFDAVNVYPDGTQEPYHWNFDKAVSRNPDGSFLVMTGRQAFEESLFSWNIHGVYATRTEINRRFPYDESSHGFSDDNTTHIHYLVSREVRCCPARYYYRQNNASISHAASPLRLDCLDANASMKRQLEALRMDDDIMDRYELRRWLVLVDAYMFYVLHRRSFSPADRCMCLSRLHRTWQSIETWRLCPSDIRKLGYYPFRCWLLFRCEEEFYFFLKRLLGKTNR